jgi:hypothetical protein
MLNTQDEYEPHQAPNHGKSGFPSKGRNIQIEAVREERKGRKIAWLRKKKTKAASGSIKLD